MKPTQHQPIDLAKTESSCSGGTSKSVTGPHELVHGESKQVTIDSLKSPAVNIQTS